MRLVHRYKTTLNEHCHLRDRACRALALLHRLLVCQVQGRAPTEYADLPEMVLGCGTRLHSSDVLPPGQEG